MSLSEEKEVISESDPLEGIDLTEYSYFPIKYPRIEEFFTKQTSMFWLPSEIDFSGDRDDWEALDDNSKTHLKFVLAFFSQVDGLLTENLAECFKRDTAMWKEVTFAYTAQELMETIHNKTYSTMIEMLISDPKEKTKVLNGIKNYPAVADIARWGMRWMKSDRPVMQRIVAVACIEGILFTSAFASIYWIKRKNVLKGLCKANEFIARDEALHTDLGVAVYHHFATVQDGKGKPALPDKKIHEIISFAVDVAEIFTRDALKVELIGLSPDDMMGYVKCTADILAQKFGAPKIYGCENPLSWMANIGLDNKTNFYEDRVTEYSAPIESAGEFSMDGDF